MPLRDLPDRPLIAIYAITWALETVGLLCFWGLPGPVLVGGATMGLLLLWTLRSDRLTADLVLPMRI